MIVLPLAPFFTADSRSYGIEKDLVDVETMEDELLLAFLADIVRTARRRGRVWVRTSRVALTLWGRALHHKAIAQLSSSMLVDGHH